MKEIAQQITKPLTCPSTWVLAVGSLPPVANLFLKKKTGMLLVFKRFQDALEKKKKKKRIYQLHMTLA